MVDKLKGWSIYCFIFLFIHVSYSQIELKEREVSKNPYEDSLLRELRTEYNHLIIDDDNLDNEVEVVLKLAKRYQGIKLYKDADGILDSALYFVSNFKKGNEKFVVKILTQKAKLYLEWRKNIEALKFLYQALEISKQVDELNTILQVKYELAEYYRKILRYEDAEKEINESLEILGKDNINDPVLKAKFLNRKAAVYNETNRVMESIFISREALEVLKQVNQPRLESISYNEMGYSYMNLQNDTVSEKFYQLSIEKSKQVNDINLEIQQTFNLAQLYVRSLQLNKFQKGINLLKYIVVQVENKNIDFNPRNVYFILYKYARQINDAEQALEYLEKFYSKERELDNFIRNVELEKVVDQYKNEQLKNENIMVRNELLEKELQINDERNKYEILFLASVAFILISLTIGFMLFRLRIKNKKIKKSNQELEHLIKEVHHRVKNNLQFMNSLIDLQISLSTNEYSIISLKNVRRRLQSMSLVHEMLYNKIGNHNVSMKKYIEELVNQHNEFIKDEKLKYSGIEFKLDVEEVYFKTSEATAIGILISEFISNSVKHAFKNTNCQKIGIQLLKNNKKHQLICYDNGVGLKGEPDMQKSLGFRLIDVFSRQLKGRYKFVNDDGLKFILIF